MKIIIHGGFFSEASSDDKMRKAKQDAIKAIVTQAYNYLETHTSLEAAVYAVSLLENDPLFNAGLGSMIQSDGQIRMSASLMDGKTHKFSGVINIQDVQNPIFVAQKLLAYDDKVLGGEGAIQFARSQGFGEYSVETPERRAEYEKKLASKGTGTVGCVAIDKDGNISAATSTGGKGFEMVGRISDSATVAGNYANKFCGVSCTGVGEDIVVNATAAKIVTRVTDGFSIKEAFDKTFSELKEHEGFCGAIAIDYNGNVYHQDSEPAMVFASFNGAEYEIFK